MKTWRKIAIIALCVALVLSLTAIFAACDDPDTHECESECPICHKCTNADCEEEVCQPKCEGNHQSQGGDEHTCDSKCPDCGKCLNAECEEEACNIKCACLIPVAFRGVWKPEDNNYHKLVISANNINLDGVDATSFAKYEVGDNLYTCSIGGTAYTLTLGASGNSVYLTAVGDTNVSTTYIPAEDDYEPEPEPEPEPVVIIDKLHGTFQGGNLSYNYMVVIEEADNENKGTITITTNGGEPEVAELISYEETTRAVYKLKVGNKDVTLEGIYTDSDKTAINKINLTGDMYASLARVSTNGEVTITAKYTGNFIAVVGSVTHKMTITEHSVSYTIGEDAKEVTLVSFGKVDFSDTIVISYDSAEHSILLSTQNKIILDSSVTLEREMIVTLDTSSFDSEQGTVTLSAPANGVSYVYNEAIIITVTAKDGWVVKSVSYVYDGGSYTPTDNKDGTYTRKATKDAKVVVIFEAAPAE